MKRICLAALVMLSFAGCGKETDSDKIGSAQACLDKLKGTLAPAQSDIDNCTDHVSGMTSPGAMGIFCSAGFIREGFSNLQHYTDAFKAIDTGTGQSQQQNMMGLLSFTASSNIATDTANAQANFTYCLASGGKGATILSAFSSLSMGLYNYLQSAAAMGGGSVQCPTAPQATGDYKAYPLADCIAALPLIAIGSPQTQQALADLGNPNVSASSGAGQLQVSLGNTILSTNRLSCSSGGNANNAMCDIFKTAIGNDSDPRQIAVNFFKGLVPNIP